MGKTNVLDWEVMAISRVPRSLAHQIGIFVVCFSALDAELNHLIEHLAGTDSKAAGVLVAAVRAYDVRTRLLEELAITGAASDGDRNKILKLARGFHRVAEYHDALLHHEFLQFVPCGKTAAAHLKNLESIEMPVELSLAWLIYNSNLSSNLAARMHQFRTGDRMWDQRRSFPLARGTADRPRLRAAPCAKAEAALIARAAPADLSGPLR